jgi:integrase/recombinase XerD
MTSDTSPRPISPLRARMIEDMTVRGFNEHTRRDYVRHVRSFAAFISRSPDTASAEDLRLFQLHQTRIGTQPPSTMKAEPVARRSRSPEALRGSPSLPTDHSLGPKSSLVG